MMMMMINSREEVPLKKGKWNVEEDQKLIAYINRYGIWNWNEMPKAAGLLRSGKSCRLRWMNYLKPDVKRGNFSKEEDELIFNLHQKLGNKWSAIAAELPGRTDNEIKNHWHTCIKKPLMNNIGVQKSDEAEKPQQEYYSENSFSSPSSSSSSSSINPEQNKNLLSEYLMEPVQDNGLIMDIDKINPENKDSSILDSQETKDSTFDLSGQFQESFHDPMEVIMNPIADNWVQNPIWLEASFYPYDYQMNELGNYCFDYIPLWQ